MKIFSFLLFFPLLTFSQGQYHRVKSVADAFFQIRHYSSAIPYYKKCLQIAGDRDSVVYKLALCYQHTHRTKEALKSYQYLLQQYPEQDTIHHLLGEMWRRNGRYQDAKKHFMQYLPKSKSPHIVYSLMAACDSAVSWKRQPQKWKVENLYRLNSSFSEISVASFRNQAIFSSNREQVVIRKKEGFYGAPSYDFYFSEKGSDSSWKKPVSFNHNFNTDEHETSGTFARGGNVFYFARTKADNDNVMRVKLYKVEKKNGLWGEVRHFVFNNSPSSFAQPFVDAKEQLLFFASDMPGGFGGTDLYVCVNDAGIWSNPYNLGPVVNTSGNETYPYYSVENEKLYFSSDGHLGMGGQDLYEAEQIEGEWSKVTNLKCPINSSADDFGIHFRNSNEGFFSSNREGGKGKEDLYLFTTR